MSVSDFVFFICKFTRLYGHLNQLCTYWLKFNFLKVKFAFRMLVKKSFRRQFLSVIWQEITELGPIIKFGLTLLIGRLSITFTANDKRQKWNFCRLSSAVCKVEWNYSYLQWRVGDVFSIFVCFIYGLEEKNSKSEVIFAVWRLPLTSCLTSLLINVIPWWKNLHATARRVALYMASLDEIWA